ncbi:MAG: hypothetical protein MK171_10060 [Pirellulales bacterium]|nr:hypothetical protein [Pirellulales bacterium]
MSTDAASSELLDDEFLPMRARILELAASLDRTERAGQDFQEDPRWGQLQQAVELLLGAGTDRTERLQLLFSRPYQQKWREAWHM